MRIPNGHLTYCTNIHPGESWPEHFSQLKEFIPKIKNQLVPDAPMGIGLRLSNQASLSLSREKELKNFREWLDQVDGYVFTVNGFPYGQFHHHRVKDQVHVPDWTSPERLAYTLRLIRILAAILPPGMTGGISTSPLSYKPWFSENPSRLEETRERSTWNILLAVEQLARISNSSGIQIHLDIEPEPDGLIGDGAEFLEWYRDFLLARGIPYLKDHLRVSTTVAEAVLREHVQLCLDICHFSVGFIDQKGFLETCRKEGIRIGKLQLSSALKLPLPSSLPERLKTGSLLGEYDEPSYLHQVSGRSPTGIISHYPDIPDAIRDLRGSGATEWRSHFHIPLFSELDPPLATTSGDVRELLTLQNAQPFTHHLEVETYTWDVLPAALRDTLGQSIVRELRWVLGQINPI